MAVFIPQVHSFNIADVMVGMLYPPALGNELMVTLVLLDEIAIKSHVREGSKFYKLEAVCHIRAAALRTMPSPHCLYMLGFISWLYGRLMRCHSPLWGLSAVQRRQAVASKLFPSPTVTISEHSVTLVRDGCCTL